MQASRRVFRGAFLAALLVALAAVVITAANPDRRVPGGSTIIGGTFHDDGSDGVSADGHT